MDQKEWETRKALKNELYALKTEMGWHRFYVENFFARKAVEKYPDEEQRELKMWEHHERQSIREYNWFVFETLGVSTEDLKANITYFTSQLHTCNDSAWAFELPEKDMQQVYRQAAARAALDVPGLMDKLDERPTDYARLRAMPDSPVIRAERQLDEMTRTDDRKWVFACSDSPRLFALEMDINWRGVSPQEKDLVLARVVDFSKIGPELRADIAEAARRLWDHSETRRVELTERGVGDKWQRMGYVARDDVLGQVIDERRAKKEEFAMAEKFNQIVDDKSAPQPTQDKEKDRGIER
jgi:hypothetical protein